MKNSKYEYAKVIQQNYGIGFEDVSEYACNSQGIVSEMSGKFKTTSTGRKFELSTLKHDLAEYQTLGYPTRVILRRIKK